MTPIAFGSDFKRILILYKPRENKRLHSDEVPSQSSHWWKGCARNHAGLRTFGGESCCEPKTTGTGFIHSSDHESIQKFEFWLFLQKAKKEGLLTSIFMDSVIFHFCSRSNSGINKLFSVDFAITRNACTGLCIDPADPPCHFFLMCSCAISPLNTTVMISYLLESVTGLKRFFPTLIKKTVITVLFKIQLFFFFSNKQNNQLTKKIPNHIQFLSLYTNKIENFCWKILKIVLYT